MNITENQILKIIQGSFEEENLEITADSSSENVSQWDSLAQLSIIVALDKAFDGKVGSIQEIATANSCQVILNLLKEHSLI